jgi:hypothetical protein
MSSDDLSLAKPLECDPKFVVGGRSILLAFADLLIKALAALDHRFGNGVVTNRGLIYELTVTACSRTISFSRAWGLAIRA